jgi:DNA-binding NarL/FixJ family response regulator
MRRSGRSATPVQAAGLRADRDGNHTHAVRIVIVEDHLMFREVLRKVCTEELGHEVVAEADDGKKAVATVAAAKPDLVLLDLHLPNLDGFGVVEEIRKALPRVRVLILSSHCDEFTVYRAERVRVQGFVDKNTNTVSTLKDAIRTVSEGRVWFSEAFKRAKAARLQDPKSFDKMLSEREQLVLVLAGAGLGDSVIAQRLGVSLDTAEKHRANVMKKIGVDSQPELMRYARAHGFTLPSSSAEGGALLP